MLRNIEGPDREWYTEEQLCAYCGISEATLAKLLKAGRAPQPRQLHRQSKLWGWESVWWLARGLDRGWITLDIGQAESQE